MWTLVSSSDFEKIIKLFFKKQKPINHRKWNYINELNIHISLKLEKQPFSSMSLMALYHDATLLAKACADGPGEKAQGFHSGQPTHLIQADLTSSATVRKRPPCTAPACGARVGTCRPTTPPSPCSLSLACGLSIPSLHLGFVLALWPACWCLSSDIISEYQRNFCFP